MAILLHGQLRGPEITRTYIHIEWKRVFDELFLEIVKEKVHNLKISAQEAEKWLQSLLDQVETLGQEYLTGELQDTDSYGVHLTAIGLVRIFS